MKNPIPKLTATEAARHFSQVLDQVESGSQYLIERRSKAVAHLGPSFFAPRLISECLAIRRSRPSVTPDKDFAKDLLEIIGENPDREAPGWD
ncbi:MAG: hypothetical protein V3T83_21600 [Acidobacteriota bacterium]